MPAAANELDLHGDKALEKVRPKGMKANSTDPARNVGMARAKLKEARALLASNQFEQAEAMALDVKSWNMTFGVFEDNPDKVASAARASACRYCASPRAMRAEPQSPFDYLSEVADALDRPVGHQRPFDGGFSDGRRRPLDDLDHVDIQTRTLTGALVPDVESDLARSNHHVGKAGLASSAGSDLDWIRGFHRLLRQHLP